MVRHDMIQVLFYMQMGDKDSVCIIGLGFVGLTLAIALCEVGVSVYGIESNETIFKSLSGISGFFSLIYVGGFEGFLIVS